MPRISPLDVLYAQRRILVGDYVAGTRFGYLAKRRNLKQYSARYAAALDVLTRTGAWPIVENAIINGHVPRDACGISRLCTALDELNRHFRKTGELSPPRAVAPGCRPTPWAKRIR